MPTAAVIDRPETVTLTVGSNYIAQRLCGPADANIRTFEKETGAKVSCRGNQFFLTADDDVAVASAKKALQQLIEAATKSELEPADVIASVRHTEKLPSGVFNSVATPRKKITARTPAQNEYLGAMKNHDITIGLGSAGTGKTYLAVAFAAAALKAGTFERLVLTRPAVEAGERLGFLPGDMKEKVDPYLRPFYDALYDMMGAKEVEQGMNSGAIEIAPLAFMRGRTLAKSIIILDEAQNTTAMQMKMFLTRLGEGGKMIITGDPTQNDLPRGTVSGLNDAIDVLQGVEGIGVVRFGEEDVVRHDLVRRIVKAYDARHANKPGLSPA